MQIDWRYLRKAGRCKKNSNMLTWANSLIVKSITRSNTFECWNKKTKDLKFVSTNISVSFLRPFSKYTLKMVSGQTPKY